MTGIKNGTKVGRIVLVLLVTLGAVDCNDSRRVPTGPGPDVSTSGNSITPTAHLEQLLSIMQAESVYARRIDWAQFRADVFAAATNAQTIPDLYPAIELALQRLNDHTSYYVIGGRRIGPDPDTSVCTDVPVPRPHLPVSIGYVHVSGCDCGDGGPAADGFAEAIQDAIRMVDRPDLAGWIVDLRGNSGGNMWPMLAGVGPVLGEGIVGWIVYNDREYEREYRNGEARSFGDVLARVTNPYTLVKPHPKVAVLTNKAVVSAGEAVAVFFRGRSVTRSFGTSTCGHPHLRERFALGDGAILNLATAVHADRMKTEYPTSVQPDEIIVDPTAVVNRAIAWLLNEP